MSPGEQICCFMEQEKRASKSEGAARVRGWEQAGEHISHDAALYLLPKWHLYLPKLSFDSLPHMELQITFNTDIKSSSKRCPEPWKAALLCGTYCHVQYPSLSHPLCLTFVGEFCLKPLRFVQITSDLWHRRRSSPSDESANGSTVWTSPGGDFIYSCD